MDLPGDSTPSTFVDVALIVDALEHPLAFAIVNNRPDMKAVLTALLADFPQSLLARFPDDVIPLNPVSLGAPEQLKPQI